MKRFKKAEMALTIILIVLIVVVFLGWLVNFASKECRSNSDCSQDSYCGSDFSCHEISIQTVTQEPANLMLPAVILGIAIIIAAIILRKGRRRPKDE